jgi:hypothetical protein
MEELNENSTKALVIFKNPIHYLPKNIRVILIMQFRTKD